MFDLSGKTALVTGATGGIGEAIARQFHKNGANIILSGRREEKLLELRDEFGKKCEYVVMDLSDCTQIPNFVVQTQQCFNCAGIDILVNNAGITRDNLFMRMKSSEWDEVLAVNLTAVFNLTQGLVKGMIKKRYGRIITIGSIVGTSGNPGQANYSAAKAALLGLTKSLAHEVASRSITVNCIAPGFIETNMTNKLNDTQKAGILAAIPVGKIGLAQDIAAAALYLAGASGNYVTGQTLHVNGGMLMV